MDKRIIQSIIALFSVFFLFYLLGCFYETCFNIALWNAGTRFNVILWGFLFGGFMAITPFLPKIK